MGAYRGKLKYPSMTGQDPMYQNIDVAEALDRLSQLNKGEVVEMPVEEKILSVYNTVIVDRQTMNIIKQETVIGGQADKGLFEIELTPEQKAWNKSGRLAIFQQCVGNFTRFIPEVSLKEKLTE